MIYNNRRNVRRVSGQGKRKNTKLVLNQLAWLLTNDKEGVVNAFKDAGFNVDDEADAKKLKSILREAVVHLRHNGRSPKAKALVTNISTLILVNEKEKLEFSNFFKKDKGSDTKTEKEKGTFLKDNSETIGKIGASIIGGLFSRGGNEQVDSQIDTLGNKDNSTFNNEPKKSKTGLIIGIGLGTIALVGLTIFLIRRNNK